MKRFCKFELHEFMDFHPTVEVQVIEGSSVEEIASNAKKWAKQMTVTYSGGPTTFKNVMSKEEAAEYLCKEFKASLLCTCYPKEEAIEDAQKPVSKKNIMLFFECYHRDEINK